MSAIVITLAILSSNVIADFVLAIPTPVIGADKPNKVLPTFVLVDPTFCKEFANPEFSLVDCAVLLATSVTLFSNSSEFKTKSNAISPTDVATFSPPM